MHFLKFFRIYQNSVGTGVDQYRWLTPGFFIWKLDFISKNRFHIIPQNDVFYLRVFFGDFSETVNFQPNYYFILFYYFSFSFFLSFPFFSFLFPPTSPTPSHVGRHLPSLSFNSPPITLSLTLSFFSFPFLFYLFLLPFSFFFFFLSCVGVTRPDQSTPTTTEAFSFSTSTLGLGIVSLIVVGVIAVDQFIVHDPFELVGTSRNQSKWVYLLTKTRQLLCILVLITCDIKIPFLGQ